MKTLSLTLLAALSLSAAGTSRIDIFTAKELQALSHSMAAKHASFSSQDLARYGNHYLMLAERTETGSSELHQHEADIFVVQSGSAAIVTGGRLVGSHTTKPGEIRGTSIAGGERHMLSAGDVIHIPAGTPHQLLIEKGEPFTYFVVKVSNQ